PARAAAARTQEGPQRARGAAAGVRAASDYLDDHAGRWARLLGWVFVRALGGVLDPAQAAAQSRTWIDEWLLSRVLSRAYAELRPAGGAARGVAARRRTAAPCRTAQGHPGYQVGRLLRLLAA